jgi:superfamily II DNA/RNA helicase
MTSTSRSAVSLAREILGTWPRNTISLSLLIQCIPVQRDVIVATLEGEDVFLQAATSFGKSLCFQLPAIVDFGSVSFHQEI